jgi:LacI family transcriptional regulator
MVVTIRDVARVAGVSVATVSRALNDSGPVRPATRARIMRFAEELNYTPNMAARSLTTRRTGVVGVLLPDLFGEFFSELIRGLDETAQALGYHLFLSSSHDKAGEIRAALKGMRARVDGLILMVPAVPPEVVRALLPRGLPVVLLSSPVPAHQNCHSLTVDNAGGARAAVAHLVGHGHRRIGMLLGPAGNYDAEERQRGYRSALVETGLEVDPQLEVPGDFTGAAGYAGVLRLRALSAPPTAIFAANDALALGALSALRELRVPVPEAVAVAGFDNISSTQYSVPPLTTVEVSISELGARAVRRLVDALTSSREAVPESEGLPARVLVRRSCGCGS